MGDRGPEPGRETQGAQAAAERGREGHPGLARPRLRAARARTRRARRYRRAARGGPRWCGCCLLRRRRSARGRGRRVESAATEAREARGSPSSSDGGRVSGAQYGGDSCPRHRDLEYGAVRLRADGGHPVRPRGRESAGPGATAGEAPARGKGCQRRRRRRRPNVDDDDVDQTSDRTRRARRIRIGQRVGLNPQTRRDERATRPAPGSYAS